MQSAVDFVLLIEIYSQFTLCVVMYSKSSVWINWRQNLNRPCRISINLSHYNVLIDKFSIDENLWMHLGKSIVDSSILFYFSWLWLSRNWIRSFVDHVLRPVSIWLLHPPPNPAYNLFFCRTFGSMFHFVNVSFRYLSITDSSSGFYAYVNKNLSHGSKKFTTKLVSFA